MQFLKGDQTIRSPITTTTTDPSAYNLVLTVTEGITGEYACKVDVEGPMMKSDRNTFEIVGKLYFCGTLGLETRPSPSSVCAIK